MTVLNLGSCVVNDVRPLDRRDSVQKTQRSDTPYSEDTNLGAHTAAGVWRVHPEHSAHTIGGDHFWDTLCGPANTMATRWPHDCYKVHKTIRDVPAPLWLLFGISSVALSASEWALCCCCFSRDLSTAAFARQTGLQIEREREK